MADVPFKAQHGEDRILAKYFASRTEGCCVEVGAFNGIDMSNTWYFDQLGWRCILVEPAPELAAACRHNRSRAVVLNCAAVAPDSPPTVTLQYDIQAPALSSLTAREGARLQSITVPARTLDAMLEEQGIDTVDFITVDVEGHEWSVLQGCTLSRWKPAWLLLERNTPFPDRRILARLWDSGYTYRFTTGVNDWYKPGHTGWFDTVRVHYLFYVFNPVAPAWWGFKHRLKLLLQRCGLFR